METTTPLYVAIGNGTEEENDDRLRGELALLTQDMWIVFCFLETGCWWTPFGRRNINYIREFKHRRVTQFPNPHRISILPGTPSQLGISCVFGFPSGRIQSPAEQTLEFPFKVSPRRIDNGCDVVNRKANTVGFHPASQRKRPSSCFGL